MQLRFPVQFSPLSMLSVLIISFTPALAGDLALDNLTAPAPFLRADGTIDTIIEASAVEPIGDGRRFLVAHDKKPALHVFDSATGKPIGDSITSKRFPAPTSSGPKWEAMARDSQGNFYIIGAHNGKTEDERAMKRDLVRFRLTDDASELPRIDDASVRTWRIDTSLVAMLQAEGLNTKAIDERKIEGLTVRERAEKGQIRRTLIIGLREPGDRVRAFQTDLSELPEDGSQLRLRPLFSFEAGSIDGVPSQLTSLEDVPGLGGQLVITSTEDADNRFHGNTLWFVADAQGASPVKLGTFEPKMKAEGLAVLSETKQGGTTTVHLLLTYDNDPHATRIPSRYQTIKVTRTRP